MKAVISIGLMALALSGCATRRAVSIDCPQFQSFAIDVPPTAIIRAIQSDVPVQSGEIFSDEAIQDFLIQGSGRVIFDQHLKQLQRRRLAKSNAPGLRAQAIVSDDMTALLLSGGGQWGAFGAGYMEELSRQQPSALPTVKFVTGVSTGALQSLYVAANQADAGKNWLADMRRHYSPQSEGEIVDRGSFLSALFTGSVAGLAPLRRKIETALCSSGEGASLQCPLIDALALEDAPLVLIGFVEARSGKMQFVLVQEIATAPIAPSEKQQCLAGAALASVAMPLHFQQVQIRSTPKGNPAAPLEAVTYYDGGVRQSVFFVLTDKIMAALARNDQAADRSGNAGATPSGDLPRTAYILRNGPTTAPLDQEVDQTASG